MVDRSFMRPKALNPARIRVAWNKDRSTIFHLEDRDGLPPRKIRIIAWGRLNIFCTTIRFGGPDDEFLIPQSDIISGVAWDYLPRGKYRIISYEKIKAWKESRRPGFAGKKREGKDGINNSEGDR